MQEYSHIHDTGLSRFNMDARFDYISLIICLGTLAGNVILNVGILVAPFIDRTVRQKRFAVLISLAIVDLLKIIPLISEIGFPSHQPKTCQAFASIGLYLICVTILHLVLESINRLVAIVRPLRYNELLTSKLFASLMAALWLLPIIGIILPLAINDDVIDWIPSLRALMFSCDQFYDTPTENQNMTQNLRDTDEERNPIEFRSVDESMIAYSAVITIVYFAIPLIIMVLAYSVIFNISLKHIRQIKSMEKNMRQLYHRISRHELISAPMSGVSKSIEDPKNEIPAIESYKSITGIASSDELRSSDNNEVGLMYRQDSATCKREESKTIDLSACPTEGIEFSAKGIEKQDVLNTNSVVSDIIAHDDRKGAESDKNKSRRKASNVVHPLKTFASMTWTEPALGHKVKTDYTELSRDYLSYNNNFTEDEGKLIEVSVDVSKEPRHSVVPVQAADIIASEYDSVIASNILGLNKTENDDTEMKDKPVTDAGIVKSDMKGMKENVFATRSAKKVADASDEIFREDSGEEKNSTARRMTLEFLCPVNEDPPRMKKTSTWSQLWLRIGKRSEEMERRSHKIDSIPSESAFIKIIEKVEKKSKSSSHSFERHAKRVMRYSALLNSHRRIVEQDEEIGERPTHAEVNHMESLLSIADKKHDYQFTSALNKNIRSCTSGDQGQSIDAFSLLTAFPVMEAWANSVRAKATPQSNSFVRFYRVIRSEMRNRKKEGKLVKTLGMLFMAWILFYVPVVAFSWSRLMKWPIVAKNDHGSSRLLISWALLSSALNPVIYCFRIPEFRRTFKKIYKALKSHLYCR